MAAHSVRGVSRVLEKLENSVRDGNYYEAHQMYRTLYFRYLAQKKYEELENMLYKGSLLFLEHDQQISGADLAILLVDVLVKSENTDYEGWSPKLCNIFKNIKPSIPEREAFLAQALRWSSNHKSTGHPFLHQCIAQVYWNEKNYSQARHHYIYSKDGQGCAKLLIELQTTLGYKCEVDLFITQTVLQYLCLSNQITAHQTFATYTQQHPRIRRSGPPYLLPLLNFIFFLLQAVETKLPAFVVLCEQYQPSIKRDPTYIEYLDKIGQIFFGVRPPQTNSGGFFEQMKLCNNVATVKKKKHEDNVDVTKVLRLVYTMAKIISNGHLIKWLNSVEKGEQVDINISETYEFVTNELNFNINEENCDKTLWNIIPYMVVISLKKWPGWHLNNKDTLEEKYLKLKKYVNFKLERLLQTDYKVAVNQMEHEKKIVFAPYYIDLKCPPSVLNSLVFAVENDDIIMKQHFITKWETLTFDQLIHLPYVEVQYYGLDISFIRRSQIDYVRFLNYDTGYYYIDKNESLLEHAEEVSPDKKCYSLAFLTEYIEQYNSILKEKLGNTTVHDEIRTILFHFLKDIQDIKQNDKIATKTQIRFRLNNNTTYIRNKKILKENQNQQRFGYCELITPKVELYVNFINIKQLYPGLDNYVEFNFTKKLKECSDSEFKRFMPTIYYKCCFCNKQYLGSGKKEMLVHLFNEHCMEYPVRCSKCKFLFDVSNLAGQRWSHTCEPNN